MKTNEQNNLKTKTLIKKNTDLFLVVLFDSETSEAFDLDAVLSRTSLLRIVHASQSCHLIRFQIIIIRIPFEEKPEKDENCFVRNVKSEMCCVEWNWTETELLFQGFAFFFFFFFGRTEQNRTERIGLDFPLSFFFFTLLELD